MFKNFEGQPKIFKNFLLLEGLNIFEIFDFSSKVHSFPTDIGFRANILRNNIRVEKPLLVGNECSDYTVFSQGPLYRADSMHYLSLWKDCLSLYCR